MILRPPRSTRTDPLFPYTTLFRSVVSPVLGGDDRLDESVAVDRRKRDPMASTNAGPATQSAERATVAITRNMVFPEGAERATWRIVGFGNADAGLAPEWQHITCE